MNKDRSCARLMGAKTRAFGALTIVVSLCCYLSNVVAATDVDLEYHSHYISEGREQLQSSGILWVSGTQTLSDNLYLAAVYGVATNQSENYDELNLIIAYKSSLGHVDY